jgi:hypothetical protein
MLINSRIHNHWYQAKHPLSHPQILGSCMHMAECRQITCLVKHMAQFKHKWLLTLVCTTVKSSHNVQYIFSCYKTWTDCIVLSRLDMNHTTTKVHIHIQDSCYWREQLLPGWGQSCWCRRGHEDRTGADRCVIGPALWPWWGWPSWTSRHGWTMSGYTPSFSQPRGHLQTWLPDFTEYNYLSTSIYLRKDTGKESEKKKEGKGRLYI